VKLLTDIPMLPLTDAQRLSGLVRLIEQKSTSLGRALVDYLQMSEDAGDAHTQAQKVIDEEMLVHISIDGHISVEKFLGFPISIDQLIQHQTLTDSYPETSFYSLLRIRTFSFECNDFDEVLAIFSTAKSHGVCMTLKKMNLSYLDHKKPSAFGRYQIEVVTTSQKSMIFKVLMNAKTDAHATLREWSQAENKFLGTPQTEEEIKTEEHREIANRIKWSQQK
jgi:hypothetical protein